MQKHTIQHFTVRMHTQEYEKLRSYAAWHGRSINQQVCYEIRQILRAFEQTHGALLQEKPLV